MMQCIENNAAQIDFKTTLLVVAAGNKVEAWRNVGPAMRDFDHRCNE